MLRGTSGKGQSRHLELTPSASALHYMSGFTCSDWFFWNVPARASTMRQIAHVILDKTGGDSFGNYPDMNLGGVVVVEDGSSSFWGRWS